MKKTIALLLALLLILGLTACGKQEPQKADTVPRVEEAGPTGGEEEQTTAEDVESDEPEGKGDYLIDEKRSSVYTLKDEVIFDNGKATVTVNGCYVPMYDDLNDDTVPDFDIVFTVENKTDSLYCVGVRGEQINDWDVQQFEVFSDDISNITCEKFGNNVVYIDLEGNSSQEITFRYFGTHLKERDISVADKVVFNVVTTSDNWASYENELCSFCPTENADAEIAARGIPADATKILDNDRLTLAYRIIQKSERYGVYTYYLLNKSTDSSNSLEAVFKVGSTHIILQANGGDVGVFSDQFGEPGTYDCTMTLRDSAAGKSTVEFSVNIEEW